MTEGPLETPVLEPIGNWRTLVRSFGALLVGEGFARAFGLVAVIVIARRLEPGGFGLVTLGATLVIWFGLIVDSGTETLNVRDIARRPDRLKQIAEPVLGLRLVLSAAAMAVFAVAAIIVSDGHDTWVFLLFALVLPARALNLRWMVLGVRASKAVAAGNVASQVVFMTGVLILVNGRHDALFVPALQIAAEVVYTLFVLGAVARRFGLLRPRLDLPGWLSTLRASLPLLVNNFARAIIYSFGLLILYGAAAKPVLFCVTAMGLFYVSFLASYSASDAAHASELFRRTLRLAAVMTVPVAAVLSAGSGFVVSLVYGKDYADAAGALAILVWAVPILAIMGPYHMALIAGERQGVLMRINLIGAGFAVIANFVAVPLGGIEGAAAVMLASQLLVLVLSYRQASALGVAPPLAFLVRARPARLRSAFRSAEGD
jgi:O-antigen/teichoic acid export membrane protein